MSIIQTLNFKLAQLFNRNKINIFNPSCYVKDFATYLGIELEMDIDLDTDIGLDIDYAINYAIELDKDLLIDCDIDIK